MTEGPDPHRDDGNVPLVDGELRTKRNGIDLQARPAETVDYGARIHVRPWRLSRGRDHRQRLRPDEIAEHLVIPSEAEEWSGLGSRDIDGQAVGRVSGKRSSQSLTIPTSVRIFGSDPGVVCSAALTGDSDNARVFGNVTPGGCDYNDLSRATVSSRP